MNVQFYVARISDATVVLSNAMGITPHYIRETGCALVTVHQDIAYLNELVAGDIALMHSGVLSVEGKKLRVAHRLTRLEDNLPAMRATALMVCVNLDRRQSVALDDEIVARARRLLVDEAQS